MTARTRRLLTAAASVVILLFVGRWTVVFLSERWWAATISPAAQAAVTRWQLLGLGLDALAVALAATWFACHAVLVARCISSVEISRSIGHDRIRTPVPMRLL